MIHGPWKEQGSRWLKPIEVRVGFWMVIILTVDTPGVLLDHVLERKTQVSHLEDHGMGS